MPSLCLCRFPSSGDGCQAWGSRPHHLPSEWVGWVPDAGGAPARTVPLLGGHRSLPTLQQSLVPSTHDL